MKHFFPSSSRLRLPTLLGALLLLGTVSTAQAQADPGSGGPIPGAQDPTAVPLDGGASLLLAGGAAYALNRLRRKART